MQIDTKEYSIFIGNVLDELQHFLKEQYSDSKKIVLVDENTEEHCLPILDWGGVDALKDAEILLIDSGEENKTIEIVNQLWESLLACQVDRKAVVINLGGGVIGDMGGFTAATYKRGIDFIQVPTTLLSMVDASIGGKLGIDINGQKNMVGLFKHPNAVFVHLEFLNSLDRRELYSGFAEVLKHALISSESYWSSICKLTNLDGVDLQEMVEASIHIKKDIVEKDFKESGLRKKLNFGHTIGHAIESLLLHTEHKLLHGEAVAAGMIAEAYLSTLVHTEFKAQLGEVVGKLLSYYTLPVLHEDTFDVLIEIMKGDKKNTGDQIDFVLLKSIGESTINHSFEKEVVKEALHFYNAVLMEQQQS